MKKTDTTNEKAITAEEVRDWMQMFAEALQGEPLQGSASENEDEPSNNDDPSEDRSGSLSGAGEAEPEAEAGKPDLKWTEPTSDAQILYDRVLADLVKKRETALKKAAFDQVQKLEQIMKAFGYRTE